MEFCQIIWTQFLFGPTYKLWDQKSSNLAQKKSSGNTGLDSRPAVHSLEILGHQRLLRQVAVIQPAKYCLQVCSIWQQACTYSDLELNQLWNTEVNEIISTYMYFMGMEILQQTLSSLLWVRIFTIHTEIYNSKN